MWPAAKDRECVLTHLAGIGVDPLAAIDVLARGALKTEAGFVVVELDGELLDFPVTLAGVPDGDFKHLGLALWHRANPETRCAFVQGRAGAFPGVEVYAFILGAVRSFFEVPVPIAMAMRAQRHDLQAVVAATYLRWLEGTQCLDPIERLLESCLEAHQSFRVHSAAWRDMKAALVAGEASVTLTSAPRPGGFTLETQAFAMTPRDTALTAVLLLMQPGSTLSAELDNIRRKHAWLNTSGAHRAAPARCLAVLGAI